MSKRKVIIDTDPGYDDACAIALASLTDKFEILGITTVAGNQTIEKVTSNALNLVSYLNMSCPVFKGMSEPLIKSLEVAKVHGESGLDNILFSSHSRKPEEMNAIQFIIKSCLENDKITIITIGPLTNIAMALKLEPKIKEHIELISIMGGANGRGNVTPAAEFNVYTDPEAAFIVFSSGVNIKMNGLDVTNFTMLNDKIIERFEKINTKSSKLFVDCMKNCGKLMDKHYGIKFSSMHDSVAVLTVIDESIIKYQKAKVSVDLNHGDSYGRTNCVIFGEEAEKSKTEIAVVIDVEKFWNLIEELYKKY